MSAILKLSICAAVFLKCAAFVPHPVRLVKSSNHIQPLQGAVTDADTDKNAFGSKLLPDFSEEELIEMFKEFNITNFDLEKDPELAKWAPSKEFFEKFGFQNMTERYKKKTSDVKQEFYSIYTKPILPQYKTFIADVMTMTHLQTIDSRYQYDAMHAFGICTQYYTIMKGYALTEEIDVIFNSMMKAIGLDATQIRADAKKILTLVKDTNLTEDDVLNAKDGDFASIFNNVRENRFFKYTDAWGLAMGRIMELIGVEPKEENFARWSKSLRWVFTQRIMQSWDEFSADQLKMQGIEAMQKQLLIREKRRAAGRLEKKAAEFESKKAALLDLNEQIEVRRTQLIEEQKALKKKFEPDAYEKLIAEK